jgi:hypothetical protein
MKSPVQKHNEVVTDLQKDPNGRRNENWSLFSAWRGSVLDAETGSVGQSGMEEMTYSRAGGHQQDGGVQKYRIPRRAGAVPGKERDRL